MSSKEETVQVVLENKNTRAWAKATEKAPGLGSSRKGLSGKVAFSGPKFAISLSEKWLFEARNRRPLSWKVAFSDEILRFFFASWYYLISLSGYCVK
jgi:hypothetical protein